MIRWANRQVRIWWPALLALVGGAILATLGFVVTTVIDGRSQDRLRNEQLAELVEQQATIIDRDRRIDAATDRRLTEAIGDVETLLAEQFAEHDHNVASKLNDMLAQIAALLDRPAGTPPSPVTARPAPSLPTRQSTTTRRSSPPTTVHRPPSRPEPTTTTTTTTTPDQRICGKRPGGPRC